MNSLTKQAVKVALSLCLSIVCALSLGWDKVYWSAVTVVVMAGNETFGHAIRVGKHRFWGTFVGVGLAFVMLQFFSQLHVVFIVVYILIAVVTAYLSDDSEYGYVFKTIFTVCTLICFAGGLNVDTSFNYAILRIQETLLGIVCFSAVFTFVWPVRTEQVFFDGVSSLLKQAQQQASLLQQRLDKPSASLNQAEPLAPFKLVELDNLRELLALPLSDSYVLRYQQAHWQQFVELLGSSLEQLNQAIVWVEQEELSAQAQAQAKLILQELLARLDCLIRAVASLDLSVLDEQQKDEEVSSEALSKVAQHLQLAAADKTKAISNIRKAYQGRWRDNKALYSKAPSFLERLGSNLEQRLQVVIKVFVATSLSFVIWIYLPLPGSFMFPMLASIFAFNLAMYPSVLLKSVFLGFAVSTVVVLTQFVLLLPMLTEIWQLAAFYFINAFVIWRSCAAPQYKVYQMISSQMLLVLTMGAMSPRPSYDMNLPFTMVLLVLISLMIIRFSMMIIEQLLPPKTQQA